MAIVVVAFIAGAALCAFVFSAMRLSGSISRDEERRERERQRSEEAKR